MKNRTLFWIWWVACIVICAAIFFLWNTSEDTLPETYDLESELTTEVEVTVPDSVEEIYYFADNEYRDTDTARCEGGKAEFAVKAHGYAVIQAMAENGSGFVFIADGEKVAYDLVQGTWEASPLNNMLMTARLEMRKKFEMPLEKLYGEFYGGEELTAEEREALEERIGETEEEYAEYVKDFAEENENNILPVYDLAQVYHGYDYAELVEMLDDEKVYAGHPMLAGAKRFRDGLYKRRSGIMFTDMTMQDTEGESVSLSDYAGRGEYVFVDFWASWCPPCRGELPNIKEVYEKYHEKEGFDVVGVSVDQSRDSWKACIEKFELPWHQMSELVGRDGLTKQVYGVGAIPCSILIDPEGRIADCDLRGKELMKRMEEIYGY